MEKVQLKPHNSHSANHLYKQECNHGTCSVFLWTTADLCDLSSDAPDPAQFSAVQYTKVATQKMNVLSQCLKNIPIAR